MAMVSIRKWSVEDADAFSSHANPVREALDLCWRVFLEFEAPEYPEEGIESFRGFVTEGWRYSSMSFYIAYDGKKAVGVLAMRPESHISLFFVDRPYQGKGIGRRLLETMLPDYPEKTITVNSSPYAVEIYKHMGFEPTAGETITDGIRYTPMKR